MSKTAKRAKSGAVAPPGGAKWEQALLAASFEDVRITFEVKKLLNTHVYIIT